MPADPLRAFAPATADWFRSAFGQPTAVQAQGWPAISRGEHALLVAPTGSGKTLAAFLWCLDRLMARPAPPRGQALRVVYVSPLKALVHDIEKNLRAPLTGIALAAERLGLPVSPIRVGMRTGDTPTAERRAFVRQPPDILVTTPESLYLLLTSQSREAMRNVEVVIVDEIHALAGTKRGAHLALSLERLEALAEGPPQRIGLSATARPLTSVAAFLGGRADGGPPDGSTPGPARPVSIVDVGVRKGLELKVIVPVEDMDDPAASAPSERTGEMISRPRGDGEAPSSIWPAIHPRILELIRAHHSTIVFVNSRRLAERLAQRLNDLAGEPIVRAHHGSIAREERLEIEDALKSGRLPALVATSSLELGIDMGAVDLVIQVESPGSVAHGLQRIGRAGHQVGEPSRGVIFPKYRGDLLETAVVVQRMHGGEIEATVVPRQPLDVLAQQLVAIATDRPWSVEGLFALVRRAENFAALGRDVFEATLGMLAGDYPAEAFADLRPRLVWDRASGTVQTRRDARTVALTSGGTIPDRGLFGVYLQEDGDGQGPARRGRGSGGRRVGELDEEMVYETRVGEVVLLGASAWRIEEIGHDRVLVSPAPGQPGRIPFWKGDRAGRPLELGRAVGAFTRDFGGAAIGGGRRRSEAQARLAAEHDLDPWAADNLLAYLAEEHDAVGAWPTDRTIVLERFRDELGDWRICLLSPFGARVHAPWALAIEARLRSLTGLDVQPMWSDDGVVVRLPATEATTWDAEVAEAGDAPSGEVEPRLPWELGGHGGADVAASAVRIAADEVEELVLGALGSSALFGSHFRENAARALLLPRSRAGRRRPLWQMRQRSAQLLGVASRYPGFPIVLETYRECLQDVFDLDGLRGVLRGLGSGDIRLHSVELVRASPFASSLTFDYIASYMYEGDAPLADRRAQALALDRDLLRELLGADELRELLDAEALTSLELELQSLTPDRAASSADALHDLLRRLGDLSEVEVAARVEGPDGPRRELAAGEWLATLARDGRALAVRVAGEPRWIAAEEAGRYRDALGVALPVGLPEAHLEAGDDPLGTLLARFARRHGPFVTAAPATRWNISAAAIEAALERLAAEGRLVRGEFRPGGTEREWCDPEVLRSLRRRSLARLRREIEPVEPAALGRFLPAWQGVAALGRTPAETPPGLDRLAEVVAQLEGLALPASVLERDILAVRVPGYAPRLLDELGAAGEVCWVGRGTLGQDDGRISLYRPDRLPLTLTTAGDAGDIAHSGDDEGPATDEGEGWLAAALREHLQRRGASFYRDLLAAGLGAARSGGRAAPTQRELLDALWSLVWSGLVTNDTFAPLRALRWKRTAREPARARLAGLDRLAPPEAAGRWWLVADAVATGLALAAGRRPSETERRHALALRLLERQGVVTRDGVVAEDVAGGFGAVYPVLRELEERGRVRRGYFIAGLGGAQFALPGAVDRLRAERADPGDVTAALTAEALSERGGDRRAVHLLAATDPANPYGAALPWPRRGEDDRRPLSRAAGAYVVLVGGEPALYLERGGRALQTLPPADAPAIAAAAFGALETVVVGGRLRRLEIQRIDGVATADSPWRDRLEAGGFRPGYRGWVVGPRG